MKKLILSLLLFISCSAFIKAQQNFHPCSHEAIMERHLAQNSNALEELEETEIFIQNHIEELPQDQSDQKSTSFEYVIPVVFHVFHFGEEGLITLEQAQSGLDIINDDFIGLNEGWNTIDPLFDPIKGTMDIQFCLASIDPNGNPTSGVNYYDDEAAMYNNVDLFQYAWDNYKYLNIYLPKYAFNGPSDFSAFAYYPSTSGSNSNVGGIIYSSYRWGFGEHSVHQPGDDWASVASHEVGHWLNVRHTFQDGCVEPGDLVDDTPPTDGTGLEFTGCDNNNFSCGVATNGENFMDYNVDCKKMFTIGQMNRMHAALLLPSRITLWSEENLIATGCQQEVATLEYTPNTSIKIYPNPTNGDVAFEFSTMPSKISLYDAQGKLILNSDVNSLNFQLNTNKYNKGIYFYTITFNNRISSGKLIIN